MLLTVPRERTLRALRALALTLAAAVVVIVGVAFTPAPSADAASYQYCKGYSNCAKQSKSNHSYSSKKHKSYWGMYAGHNCTNYASYMMVKAGASSKRPAALTSGMGYGWGTSFKDKTDKSPAMGSIAWWGKNKGGYGSTGHVAYVERVVSSSEIIVSEEGSRGFRWRKVTKGGVGWPTGFIHIKDVPEYKAKVVTHNVYTNKTLKTKATSTNIKQGSTAWVKLTYKNVGAKNWKGAHVITSDDSKLATESWVNGTHPVADSAKTYKHGNSISFVFPITVPDVKDKTAIYESFSLVQGGDDKAVSSGTAKVGFHARDNVFSQKPVTVVSGDLVEDATLTATAGVWTPTTALVEFQWLRNGVAIEGATSDSYILTKDDVGAIVTVRTTVSAPFYTTYSSTTVNTTKVAQAVIPDPPVDEEVDG